MNEFIANLLGCLFGVVVLSLPVFAVAKLVLTLVGSTRLSNRILDGIVEFWGVFGLTAFFFLLHEFNMDNDCCNMSATFSPSHRLSIVVVIMLCMWAFYMTRHRDYIAPPLLEVLYNTLLVIGVVLNVILVFHVEEPLGFANLTIACFLLIRLIQNFRLLKSALDLESESDSIFENWSKFILRQNAWSQYPIFLFLCIPLLVLIACLLLVFGQEPDSMIRALTDTYKHGFSQWDYKCDNVQCGGHYLCSVAAQGHPSVVKPIRYGHRQGGLIICNRQLLISNAFEEMIQVRFPIFHKSIRRQYDRVGDGVKRHYHLFSIKWISDIVYILMKPLEWLFLISLYLFESEPESKIAKQYLKMS